MQDVRLVCGNNSAVLDPKGAVLTSLLLDGHEVMWEGAEPWPKRGGFSVSFPFFACPAYRYLYRGKVYPLPRHGFVRDRVLTLEEGAGATHASFVLAADDETRKFYPFEFLFRIAFDLTETELTVTLAATNTGSEPMPYSMASHPGFALPRWTSAAPCKVRYEKEEEHPVWMPDENGVYVLTPETPIRNRELVLTPQLFAKDGVFTDADRIETGLQSRSVALIDGEGRTCLHFAWETFSALGVWSKPLNDALSFVCFEPICGLVTSPRVAQERPAPELADLTGLCVLKAGETKEVKYFLRKAAFNRQS